MIGHRLRDEQGNIITTFFLPESLSEIKLSQYVDFVTATKRLIEDKPDEEIENPVVVMADAVMAVSGVPLNEILKSQVGDIYTESKELDETLRGSYSWIAKVLTSYKPKNRTETDFLFEYDGHKFKIPYIATSPLFHKAILPNISTGQAISAFEMMRLSKRAVEKKGDPKGNRMFTDYLELLAILALKEGETLPTEKNDRQYFIEERIKFFKEIPAEIAIDVDFFLNSTLVASNQTHCIVGSLSLHLFGIAAAMLKRKGQRTKKRRLTARKFSTV